MMAIQMLLAISAFVLPLWVVHRRLLAEKNRLLAEHNCRVETTLERLHCHLDQNEMDQVNQINPAMTALNAERAVLSGIPTWPWRTGTLGGFVSAIILPLVLFLVQLGIRKWLGG